MGPEMPANPGFGAAWQYAWKAAMFSDQQGSCCPWIATNFRAEGKKLKQRQIR